ncbi:prephenate dehydratase [Spelaeicoccus albus]|uniref:Prephenate dehydratase n=1 Tax=Spelaeicoccus albus TaxID=1280376 RepID=A0A7Z0ACH4_9MICO|nr:prephenate dehydratase [Spelaeicoccus albus]NYI67415.1 prephenate dehydratase [Spelaeicoccus albus]
MNDGTRSRYAYLGPSATFTESALLQLPEAADAERVPMPGVIEALEAVRTGEVSAAVAPIENSVEGGVSATLDALISDMPLQIMREFVVPIKFVLAARPGVKLSDIRTYATHPHAEAQTRRTIGKLLPGVTYLQAASTAAAAAGLGADLVGAPYEAAVCNELAAWRYGLHVVADNVGDIADAETRFVLVSKPSPVPPPTGADRTSIVAGLRTEAPGALLELLEQFAARGVNLTRIESRPTGDGLGLYQFSLDVDGHISEARVAEALSGVHRTARSVRFLGSYPRADGRRPLITEQTTDDAFGRADAWLDAVSHGCEPS